MVGRKRELHDSQLGIEINNNEKKKKIQSNQSYLSDDIVEGILVNIPAEALYNKFRYVCKSWFNIISNPTPSFVQRNLLCSSEPGLIYQGTVQTCFRINGDNNRSDQHTYFIKLKEGSNQEHDLSTWFKDFTINACCNGLLLLTSKRIAKHRYVANHVTKQLVMLPPCSSSSTRKPEFAYVPSTGEYKVMIPLIDDDSWTRHFHGYEILTFGGGFDREDLRWRRIEAPEIQLHYYSKQQKTVNGVSHVFQVPGRIASFDVCTEVFHLNPLPSFGWASSRASFVEMGSFLAFVDVSSSKNQLEIWILKDFRTGEWIKQHSIDMFMANKHFKYDEKVVPVMGFGNSSDPTIILGSKSRPARFWAYNVKLQRWWKMGGMKIMTAGITSFFGSHTNSLVSLNTLIRKKQTM